LQEVAQKREQENRLKLEEERLKTVQELKEIEEKQKTASKEEQKELEKQKQKLQEEQAKIIEEQKKNEETLKKQAEEQMKEQEKKEKELKEKEEKLKKELEKATELEKKEIEKKQQELEKEAQKLQKEKEENEKKIKEQKKKEEAIRSCSDFSFKKDKCEGAILGSLNICRFLKYSPEFTEEGLFKTKRQGRCVPSEALEGEKECKDLSREKCTLVGYLAGVSCKWDNNNCDIEKITKETTVNDVVNEVDRNMMLIKFKALPDTLIRELVNKTGGSDGKTFLQRFLAGPMNSQAIVDILDRYLNNVQSWTEVPAAITYLASNRGSIGDQDKFLGEALSKLALKDPAALKNLTKPELERFFALVPGDGASDATLKKYFENAFLNTVKAYDAIAKFAVKNIGNTRLAKPFGESLPTNPGEEIAAISAFLKAAIEEDIKTSNASSWTNLPLIITQAEIWFNKAKSAANKILIGQFTLSAANQYLLVGAAVLSNAKKTYQEAYLTKVCKALQARNINNFDTTAYKGLVKTDVISALNTTGNKDAAFELIFGSRAGALDNVIGKLATANTAPDVKNYSDQLFSLFATSTDRAATALAISNAKLSGGKFFMTDLVEKPLTDESSLRFISVLSELANKQVLFTTQSDILLNLFAKARPTTDSPNSFNNVVAEIAKANPDVGGLVTAIEKNIEASVKTAQYNVDDFNKALAGVLSIDANNTDSKALKEKIVSALAAKKIPVFSPTKGGFVENVPLIQVALLPEMGAITNTLYESFKGLVDNTATAETLLKEGNPYFNGATTIMTILCDKVPGQVVGPASRLNFPTNQQDDKSSLFKTIAIVGSKGAWNGVDNAQFNNARTKPLLKGLSEPGIEGANKAIESYVISNIAVANNELLFNKFNQWALEDGARAAVVKNVLSSTDINVTLPLKYLLKTSLVFVAIQNDITYIVDKSEPTWKANPLGEPKYRYYYFESLIPPKAKALASLTLLFSKDYGLNFKNDDYNYVTNGMTTQADNGLTGPLITVVIKKILNDKGLISSSKAKNYPDNARIEGLVRSVSNVLRKADTANYDAALSEKLVGPNAAAVPNSSAIDTVREFPVKYNYTATNLNAEGWTPAAIGVNGDDWLTAKY
jgi:hypothetical protein